MRRLINVFIIISLVPVITKKSEFSQAASSNRHRWKKRISASFAVLFNIVSVLTTAEKTEAAAIVVDPGPAGSVSWYVSDLFFTLNGTVHGQSQALDFYFADNKFEVAPSLGVVIDMYQSGAIGTWPGWLSVTGYLMDAAGQQVSSTLSLPGTGIGPAQIWPGVPFYLPDGTPYLPATTTYGAQFGSTPINVTSTGYYLQPMIFSGIHLDITYPDSLTETLIGGRLNFYSSQIYNSPNPLPTFYVNIPESTSTILLLSLGLIGLEAMSWKLKT